MIIDLIGDDRIVFSTDYPHGDSDFPEGVEEFLEMKNVSKESQKKILWDNCARCSIVIDSYGVNLTSSADRLSLNSSPNVRRFYGTCSKHVDAKDHLSQLVAALTKSRSFAVGSG